MRKLIWALALLTLVLALAYWSAPADVVWRRLSEQAPMLRLQGVSGRVWDGKAEGLSVRALPLGAASWRFSPWQGLFGRAAGRLNVQGEQFQLDAAIDASRDQVIVRELKSTLPARMLEPALDIPAFRLLGNIDVQAERVQIANGVVLAADGSLTWQDLGVTGLAEARLGGVRVDFRTEGDSVIGQIKDLGGPLSAEGQIRLRGQFFNAEAKLAARDPAVKEALLYVGERLPDGSSLLRIEGSVEKLF